MLLVGVIDGYSVLLLACWERGEYAMVWLKYRSALGSLAQLP